ncbi:hypothetical protein LIPSTDRAFT_31126 [Lipomyces starkeyi NRRL Y-11557]|uniref:Uncharacterized protein n=1 Tax=Lipomyces starkeyi NRRL Y-11557 TaxID=675824 RepID=A0A1E3PTQ0_LIPST|nr:hypothetical protein LIPSTDRAFT_31126 [Lipomyces starkeyi NRRL Y-11557]
MINRDSRGHQYSIVRAFAKDVFINQERKLGDRRRFEITYARACGYLVVNSDLKGEASLDKDQGDIIKLREHPKDLTTKPISKEIGGRVNDPGYGNNVRYVTMGNPQPSPKLQT